MIDEIKRSVKKIKKEKTLHSVLGFTVRFCLIQKNGENYICQIKYPSCAEFQAVSFDKKGYFNPRNNAGETLRIHRGRFFIRRPLVIPCFF